MSTPSKSEILSKLLRSGCDELVHHFETVDGFTPNCSANHLLVHFFSTKTTLMRFISSITLFLVTKLVILFHVNRKHEVFLIIARLKKQLLIFNTPILTLT